MDNIKEIKDKLVILKALNRFITIEWVRVDCELAIKEIEKLLEKEKEDED